MPELRYRLAEPFGYRTSFPDGKRWTVTDGSGFDNDVFVMFDTEAEAAAAVKALNRLRDEVLPRLSGESGEPKEPERP